jgi:hypothetical protein
MRRSIICQNQLSGSSLKSLARCRKMYISTVNKELVLRMNRTNFEMDEHYWTDLANTLNDLDINHYVESELTEYWKNYDYSKPIKDFYFDIYSTREEPNPYDTMIDHA